MGGIRNLVLGGVAAALLSLTACNHRKNEVHVQFRDPAPLAEIVDLEQAMPVSVTPVVASKSVLLAQYEHSAVNEVTVVHEGKGIVLVPWLRTRGRAPNDSEIVDIVKNHDAVLDVVCDLFDKRYADALLVQETTPDVARSYNKLRMTLPLVMAVYRPGWVEGYKTLCESRPWTLVGSNLESSEPSSLEAINIQHQRDFRVMISRWQHAGWTASSTAFESHRAAANADMEMLCATYCKQISVYYEEDPGAAVLYERENLREQAVIASAQLALQKGARNVMVVYDTNNEQGLRAEAARQGVSLTVVRTKGVPAYVDYTDEARRALLRKQHFWLDEEVSVRFPAIDVRYRIDIKSTQLYQQCIVKGKPLVR